MTDKTQNQAPADRLSNAYERMLDRLHDALGVEGRMVADRLHQALEQVRERSVELEELTREEAERIADYLRRDVLDAAHYLADGEENLGRWLRFDLELVEERLLERFMLVADRTRLEIETFGRLARAQPLYVSGEISAPGVLVCVQCGAEVRFTAPQAIPPCPQCAGETFQRETEAAGEVG